MTFSKQSSMPGNALTSPFQDSRGGVSVLEILQRVQDIVLLPRSGVLLAAITIGAFFLFLATIVYRIVEL